MLNGGHDVPAQGRGLVYESGEWEVDLARCELRARGVPVPLGNRAFQIFSVLVQSAGELVTKDELMARVWPDAIVEDNTLQFHISAIRKALGTDRATVKTAFGRGYRLVGHWKIRREGTPAAVPARSVETRFEALHASGLTALAGREEESALLQRRWSQAKKGEGQVVLLAGEAGIGKSRLTAALLERLTGEPHTSLRFFCSPQHTNSALYPIIGQMERAARLMQGDTPQARLDKLDALLARSSTSIQDAALFAEMLSLPNDGRYPKLELPAELRRQRTLEAFRSQIESLACEKPVLMVFEDAQWIDPTSLEVLGWIVDRIATLRVLLIVTFRLEFELPWIGRPYVTTLTIDRLPQRDVDTMIDRVVSHELIPANIRHDIIKQTDGIPLFVEEMTKAVLEARSEGAAVHNPAAIPSLGVAVPASLHESLMARLDRLGPAKEVAQIGAAIGREFSYALLTAAACKPELELGLALDRIVAAGLLFRWGVPPDATYLFKHALVQDAAYGTLRPDPRRALHARIAESIESGFADIAQNQPELLARHWAEAGLVEKAAHLWGKAGACSLERSALIEAEEQLARAVGLLAALPTTPAVRREQIKLQVALISPLIHIKGYAAPETKAAVEQADLLIAQAEALGEPLEDPLLLVSVFYGFWVANYLAFNGDILRELAAKYLALAEKTGSAVCLMIAHRAMGISLSATGDIAQGRVHFDRAIALYDPTEHRPLATRFGHDNRVAVLSYRSWTLWYLGYPEAALVDAEHALRDAREIGHAATLMYALFHASFPYTQCGNYVVANALLDQLLALADDKGSLFWKAFGMLARGYISASTGKASDTVQIAAIGLNAFRSTSSTLLAPLHLSYLARAYADLGQFDDAWRRIDEAMRTVETRKEKWCEAEVHRAAGEIALMLPYRDTAKAEAHFERALSVARGQQAKSWELRAAMSLARLRCVQGKQRQARDLLGPVYGWFTQGFETRDLKEAKAFLTDLAPKDSRVGI